MKEKADMMYGADEVVTIDGTSSLFTIFCKPTARLTILTRRINCWDLAQQLVTEALGIKEIFLVNVSGNFLDGFSGDEFLGYAFGMTLAYATKEFKEYVKYVYNEDIDITPEESLKKFFYDYLTYFPTFYSNMTNFQGIRSVRITDILLSMSEVFLGKALDNSHNYLNEDEFHIKKLENRIRTNNEVHAEKMKQLSDKAKKFIDEITSLRQTVAKLEAENKQLRDHNAELTSYMAEISTLLDALETGNV